MRGSSSRGSFAFHGTLIHAISAQDTEVVTHGLLVVGKDGKIALLEKDVEEGKVDSILAEQKLSAVSVKKLKRGEFLIPGFIDTHSELHASVQAQLSLTSCKTMLHNGPSAAPAVDESSWIG